MVVAMKKIPVSSSTRPSPVAMTCTFARLEIVASPFPISVRAPLAAHGDENGLCSSIERSPRQTRSAISSNPSATATSPLGDAERVRPTGSVGHVDARLCRPGRLLRVPGRDEALHLVASVLPGEGGAFGGLEGLARRRRVERDDARGFDLDEYAVAHGARIIAGPIGGQDPLCRFARTSRAPRRDRVRSASAFEKDDGGRA